MDALDDTGIDYNELTPEMQLPPVVEGEETSIQFWRTFVSEFLNSLGSGDIGTAWKVVTDATAESWENFWKQVEAGDTPWFLIGTFFFVPVILVNSARLLIILITAAFEEQEIQQRLQEEELLRQRGPPETWAPPAPADRPVRRVRGEVDLTLPPRE